MSDKYNKLQDKTQIAGPRGYVNSKDELPTAVVNMSHK